MRRPLPNQMAGSTQDGVTPTPAPATPTSGPVTPTPGPVTPSPTPTSTQTCEAGTEGCFPHQPDTVGTTGYGYNVDCQARTSTCTKVTNSGPTGTADIDYSQLQFDSDNVSCPTAQSADADALAQITGLIPVSVAGADHGLSMCDGGPDQPGNTSIYSSYSYCGDDLKTQVYCDRDYYSLPYKSGSGRDGTVRMSDLAACAAQEKNAIWQDLQDQGYGMIDPSTVFTAAGKACKPWRNYNITGAKCTYDGSSQPYTCTSLNITDDGTGNITVNDRRSTDKYSCSYDQGLDADQRKILASYGFLPGDPDVASQCGAASLYGANRVCTTSVTYDPGWPQSGQSHVDSTSKVACYAILNKDDPDTMTIQAAPEAACQNHSLSDADRTFLHGLAPDIYPYDELPTSCVTIQGGPYNYQRDTIGHNVTAAKVGGDINPSKCDGSPKYKYKVEYDVPYVCTDSAPGDYYGGLPTGLASSYPMNRGTCTQEHVADTQKINQDIADNGSANMASLPEDSISTSLGENCLTFGFGGDENDSDTVSDSQDSSKYHVTSFGYCINPIC